MAALAASLATSCDSVGAAATPSPSITASPTSKAHVSGAAARAPYLRDIITGGGRTLAKFPRMASACGRSMDTTCLGALMDAETAIIALNEDDSKYTVPSELQDLDGRVREFLTVSIRGVRSSIDGVIDQQPDQVAAGIAQAQSTVGDLTAVLAKLRVVAT
jgi:hypothetical protein